MLATVVERDQKAPFSIATTPRCRGRRYSFPRNIYILYIYYLLYIYVCVSVCVCVCVCVQSAMSKLSSKSCKIQNDTDISLYQIYLPKLLENILKFYRLDLFKEIAICFNHGHQTTSESPESISDGLLVNIGKWCLYLCFHFVPGVAWSFFLGGGSFGQLHSTPNNQRRW